jgi:hypothetical protein
VDFDNAMKIIAHRKKEVQGAALQALKVKMARNPNASVLHAIANVDLQRQEALGGSSAGPALGPAVEHNVLVSMKDMILDIVKLAPEFEETANTLKRGFDTMAGIADNGPEKARKIREGVCDMHGAMKYSMDSQVELAQMGVEVVQKKAAATEEVQRLALMELERAKEAERKLADRKRELEAEDTERKRELEAEDAERKRELEAEDTKRKRELEEEDRKEAAKHEKERVLRDCKDGKLCFQKDKCEAKVRCLQAVIVGKTKQQAEAWTSGKKVSKKAQEAYDKELGELEEQLKRAEKELQNVLKRL